MRGVQVLLPERKPSRGRVYVAGSDDELKEGEDHEENRRDRVEPDNDEERKDASSAAPATPERGMASSIVTPETLRPLEDKIAAQQNELAELRAQLLVLSFEETWNETGDFARRARGRDRGCAYARCR